MGAQQSIDKLPFTSFLRLHRNSLQYRLLASGVDHPEQQHQAGAVQAKAR
jgi:hypothetical protein